MNRYTVTVVSVRRVQTEVNARSAEDAVARARGESPGAVLVAVEGEPYTWSAPDGAAGVLRELGYELDAEVLDRVRNATDGDLYDEVALGLLEEFEHHMEADLLAAALAAPSPSSSLPE